MRDGRRFGQHVALLLALVLARAGGDAAEAPDYESGEWKNVIESLHLSEAQSAAAGKIWSGIRARAEMEREKLADNPEALIQASRIRQQTVDEQLESVLTPEQRVEFRKWKIERDREWEFHYLLEGFLLTGQQAVSVKAIVDGVRGSSERTLPGGTGNSEKWDGADSRFRSKIGGVDVGMGPTRNRQNAGVNTGIGHGGGADEASARSDQEKNGKIYGILSNAQRNLAGIVFRLIRAERESRMKRFMNLN